MNEEKTKARGGPDVPLGWVALVIGIVLLVTHFAGRVGLINKAPASLLPIGIALFVSGYIACFALRRVYRRIEELEQRIDTIAKRRAQE
jgi:hypothetical protein